MSASVSSSMSRSKLQVSKDATESRFRLLWFGPLKLSNAPSSGAAMLPQRLLLLLVWISMRRDSATFTIETTRVIEGAGLVLGQRLDGSRLALTNLLAGRVLGQTLGQPFHGW